MVIKRLSLCCQVIASDIVLQQAKNRSKQLILTALVTNLSVGIRIVLANR